MSFTFTETLTRSFLLRTVFPGYNKVVGDPNRRKNGTQGADLYIGSDRNETFDGGSGDDVIYGFLGNDSLRGGNGADLIFGGAGNDWLYGDDGNDTLSGGTGNDYLDGGKGDDWLYGGEGDDAIRGGNGNDRIFGGLGSDKLYGDDGDDWIYGAFSALPQILTSVDMRGGNGDDHFFPGNVDTTIDGGNGIDTLHFGQVSGTERHRLRYGVTVFMGSNRADMAWGDFTSSLSFANIENIVGSRFNDYIAGNQASNVLNGGDGDDEIWTGGGNDTLIGGKGDDLYVITRDDLKNSVTIQYDSGHDTVQFQNLGDRQVSVTQIGQSNDALIKVGGYSGSIRLLGGWNAYCDGTLGLQSYNVQQSTIVGLNGSMNVFHANAGSETWMHGGSGDDLFYSGSLSNGWTAGVIEMFGNDGADTFDISGQYDAGTITVEDFGFGNDRLRLDKQVFGNWQNFASHLRDTPSGGGVMFVNSDVNLAIYSGSTAPIRQTLAQAYMRGDIVFY